MSTLKSSVRELIVEPRATLLPGILKYTFGPRVEYLGIHPSNVTEVPCVKLLFGHRENKTVCFQSAKELDDAASLLARAAAELRSVQEGERGLDDEAYNDV